jgi:hypothetical protein
LRGGIRLNSLIERIERGCYKAENKPWRSHHSANGGTINKCFFIGYTEDGEDYAYMIDMNYWHNFDMVPEYGVARDVRLCGVKIEGR